MAILPDIHGPEDVRRLDEGQLGQLAKELRQIDNRIQAANWTTELIGLD